MPANGAVIGCINAVFLLFHEVTEESQKLADRDVVRMLSSRYRQTNLERVLATPSGNEDFLSSRH